MTILIRGVTRFCEQLLSKSEKMLVIYLAHFFFATTNYAFIVQNHVAQTEFSKEMFLEYTLQSLPTFDWTHLIYFENLQH